MKPKRRHVYLPADYPPQLKTPPDIDDSDGMGELRRDRAWNKGFDLLFRYYGIKPRDEHAWQFLSLALATQFVPGLRRPGFPLKGPDAVLTLVPALMEAMFVKAILEIKEQRKAAGRAATLNSIWRYLADNPDARAALPGSYRHIGTAGALKQAWSRIDYDIRANPDRYLLPKSLSEGKWKRLRFG